MRIQTKLALSFGIIISILCVEIVLNQIISHNATKTYQKLKTEALPALRILDSYESINNEFYLLTSNKVYNNNLSLNGQNRLSGILEVELPYLESELLLLANNIDNTDDISVKAPQIIKLTNDLIELGTMLNDLLVTKDDYDNPRKLEVATNLVEVSVANIHNLLKSNLLELKMNYSDRLESYQNEFAQDLKSLSNIILFTGLVGILFGIAVAFLVIRSISNPIQKLNNAAIKVSHGDYQSSIDLKGKDELASLGDSFNLMTSSLQDSFELIKRNSEEIKEQEERFRKVIEASPAAIILMNQDRKINLVNLQTERLFKYNRDELIGLSAENLIPERLLKEDSATPDILKSTEKIESLGIEQNFYGLTRLGKEVPIEVRLNFIRINNEDMILASVIDITERKHQEAEIKKYVDMLQFKNKELEQFSYITSHDLQEPLRTVLSFIDVIQEDYVGKLDKDLDVYLKYISEASIRMSDLIKSLLDYSRIGYKGKVENIDCNVILDSVIADLGYKIEQSKAEIHSEKLPIIEGFNLELRLLFQNLITNAIKFSKKTESPKINISFVEKKLHWQFSISDNGIGIGEEFQNKIFVIFQRLHNREEYEGTGIGLSHCKKIVELHGGEIWVTSEKDLGSTFSFTIPKDIN